VPCRVVHCGSMNVKWYGNVDGAEVLAVNQRWIATQSLDPAWTVEHGYRIEILGDPSVYVKVDMLPTAEDLADLTPERMRGIGLRITAAPLVNAIPAVSRRHQESPPTPSCPPSPLAYSLRTVRSARTQTARGAMRVEAMAPCGTAGSSGGPIR
jgi:hypothetical protein